MVISTGRKCEGRLSRAPRMHDMFAGGLDRYRDPRGPFLKVVRSMD